MPRLLGVDYANGEENGVEGCQGAANIAQGHEVDRGMVGNADVAVSYVWPGDAEEEVEQDYRGDESHRGALGSIPKSGLVKIALNSGCREVVNLWAAQIWRSDGTKETRLVSACMLTI